MGNSIMLLAEVEYWIVQLGKGHVVVEARGLAAWSVTVTACGLSIQNHWPNMERPHRICRECKKAIKDFVFIGD